jgi:hypothetical protein
VVTRQKKTKLTWVYALLVSIYLTGGHLSPAWAVDTADVLPAGIRSLSIKAGTLMGLNELYTNAGELAYLSTVNSVELNADTLSQFDSRVEDLERVLNSFGNFGVGTQMHLGRLSVEADPAVQYIAPLFLYGVSKKLTLGIALPVIFYHNEVDVAHSGGNLAELQSTYAQTLPELAEAFRQLNRDLRAEFHKTLNEKGYDPLADVNEQFLGDIQLFAGYQFGKYLNWTHAAQLHVGLPTGPKPDADSLTDLENFGRWSLRPTAITQWRQSRQISWVASASYQFVLPGTEEKRVPLGPEDTLPDRSQKMDLQADVGDSWSLSGARTYKFNSKYAAALGYTFEQKLRDQFAGAPGGRENYLEVGTERLAHVGKMEFTYSTIDSFMKKKAMIPGTIVYEVSKVFAGQNIENQFKHEVWLSVYF